MRGTGGRGAERERRQKEGGGDVTLYFHSNMNT